MPRNTRPFDFDPQSPDQLEDREFFEGQRQGGNPSPEGREILARATPSTPPPDPDITVEKVQQLDLVDGRGRVDQGPLFETRESQRVTGHGTREESVGRLYESSYGRVITSKDEVGGRCQYRRLLGGMCGALIHKEELEKATCRICGTLLCRHHVRLSEGGLSYCRKHRKHSAFTEQESLPTEATAQRPKLRRSKESILKRILVDTFTMPEQGDR